MEKMKIKKNKINSNLKNKANKQALKKNVNKKEIVNYSIPTSSECSTIIILLKQNLFIY